MFKITEYNITKSCDICGIDLDYNLTLDDINSAKDRYHVCVECDRKIQEYYDREESS